jgi:hypothetical protein
LRSQGLTEVKDIPSRAHWKVSRLYSLVAVRLGY